MVKLVCKNCGKIYYRKQNGTNFCSRNCYFLYKRIPDEKTYLIDNKTNCWNSILAKDKDGYGLISVNGKSIRHHRYIYEKYKEKIPNGLVLDHLCKNPSCVNPKHLEIVSIYENYIRGRNAKIDKLDVSVIKGLYKLDNYDLKRISNLYNLSIAQISRILNNKTWNNY